MALASLSARQRASLLRSAALLFGFGLSVGMLFTFNLIGHVVVWPLIPDLALQVPGTDAAWHRAHLGAIINSIAMIAFTVAGSYLRLNPRTLSMYALCVQVTGWGNSIAFVIGALASERGLAFGMSVANSVMYLLFLSAALTAYMQAWLLWKGSVDSKDG